eukprot:Gb_11018 [translate_table: standard]
MAFPSANRPAMNSTPVHSPFGAANCYNRSPLRTLSLYHKAAIHRAYGCYNFFQGQRLHIFNLQVSFFGSSMITIPSHSPLRLQLYRYLLFFLNSPWGFPLFTSLKAGRPLSTHQHLGDLSCCYKLESTMAIVHSYATFHGSYIKLHRSIKQSLVSHSHKIVTLTLFTHGYQTLAEFSSGQQQNLGFEE